jgi:hypothetical protein
LIRIQNPTGFFDQELRGGQHSAERITEIMRRQFQQHSFRGLESRSHRTPAESTSPLMAVERAMVKSLNFGFLKFLGNCLMLKTAQSIQNCFILFSLRSPAQTRCMGINLTGMFRPCQLARVYAAWE